MKNLKKLASLILALAMTLGLAITASAAETATTYRITINNSATGHTYEAYQIFAGDLSTSGVLSNITWGSGVTEAAQTDLGDAAALAATLTSDNVEEFAETISAYLGTATGTTSGDTYVISGLEAGYYLVKDKDGSVTGEGDTYTRYILEVVANTEVTAKSEQPSSQKKVKDTNDSTGDTTGWQDSADYDIGDDVPFQLTGVVAADYAKYDTYTFIFHDTESAGLSFNNDVKVYVGGEEITSGFEVVTTGLEDGCTFEVRFADLKDIDSVAAGSVITVEYTSKLNENAVLGSTGNPNEMYLEYSNNPNASGEGETGTTPKDKVIVFTYQTIVTKTDGAGNALTGADFALDKFVPSETGTDTYNGVTGTWTEVAASLKSVEGNVFTFKGLDDGYYRLRETVTPDGYNTIEDQYFTITAAHDETSDDPALTELNGNPADGMVITFTSSTENGSLSTTVENKSGSTLPETGGMGTTVLYVVGAVLVLGAGILLITKKRMSNGK